MQFRFQSAAFTTIVWAMCITLDRKSFPRDSFDSRAVEKFKQLLFKRKLAVQRMYKDWAETVDRFFCLKTHWKLQKISHCENKSNLARVFRRFFFHIQEDTKFSLRQAERKKLISYSAHSLFYVIVMFPKCARCLLCRSLRLRYDKSFCNSPISSFLFHCFNAIVYWFMIANLYGIYK